jgi:signal transduction histidine kinase
MRWILFLFLVLQCGTCFSQTIFETFTPANGLVDTKITELNQDRYGRLIISTREGFSIYDGQRFQNYSSLQNESMGIVNGFLYKPDSSQYLLRFTGSPIKIGKKNCRIDTSFLPGIREINKVVPLGGLRYMILTNLGSYILNNNQMKPFVLENQPENLTANILSVVITGNYYFFISMQNESDAKLVIYDRYANQLIDLKNIPNFKSVVQDRNGQIYFKQQSDWFTADTAFLAAGKIVFRKLAFQKYLKPGTNIENLFFDQENRIWCISRDEGCFRIDQKKGIEEFYNTNKGLLPKVGSMFQDREKNLWFLSQGRGIQKLVHSGFDDVSPLAGNESWERQDYIHQTPDGSVFVNGNHHAYQFNNLSFKKLRREKFKNNSNTFFWQNNYWKFTDSRTLVSDRNDRITLNIPAEPLWQVSGKIKLDQKGNLLIAGTHFYLLPATGPPSVVQLPYFTDNISLDESGNYWAFIRGASEAGIYRYENGSITQTKIIKTGVESVRCVAYWKDNLFLVGTRYSGLHMLLYQNGVLKSVSRFNKERGLSNDFIIDLSVLNSNKIALATAAGVDIITLYHKDTSIQRLSLGVNIYDPIQNIAHDAAGNLLAVSEVTGKIYLHPSSPLATPEFVPESYFSAVYINGIYTDSIMNRLNYNENNILFQVSAPSFTDNKNINFFFRLEGSTTKKIFNNTGDFEVNNLQPGSYHLFVKISFPGNIYPDQELHYFFTIRNPFWKTWWFYCFISLVCFVLLWLYFQTKFNRKLEKQHAIIEQQKAVESERTRIATDMHDDLGSGLTKITYLSQMALQKENKVEDLTNIHKTSVDLVENMSEIIWAMKDENNSLEDLLYYIKRYAMEYGADNNLNCKVYLPEKLNPQIVSGQNRRNIFLAVKEILHNIVKHANAKNVSIDVTYDSEWHIEIRDDGIGLTKNEKFSGGNGIKNIKKRIAAVNGSVTFLVDKGTVVSLTIPV